MWGSDREKRDSKHSAVVHRLICFPRCWTWEKFSPVQGPRCQCHQQKEGARACGGCQHCWLWGCTSWGPLWAYCARCTSSWATSPGLVGQLYRLSCRDTVRAGDGAALLLSVAAYVWVGFSLTQVLTGGSYPAALTACGVLRQVGSCGRRATSAQQQGHLGRNLSRSVSQYLQTSLSPCSISSPPTASFCLLS